MLAVGDCAHCAAASARTIGITGLPLIVVGLIDVHWDQKVTPFRPWQRTDKETLFSELALHLASAARASDRMWPW